MDGGDKGPPLGYVWLKSSHTWLRLVKEANDVAISAVAKFTGQGAGHRASLASDGRAILQR